MYDAPSDALAVLGWVCAGLVAVVLGLRAVRSELRARSAARPGAPVLSRTERLGDVVLDLAGTAAVVGLLVVLVRVVLEGLGT